MKMGRYRRLGKQVLLYLDKLPCEYGKPERSPPPGFCRRAVSIATVTAAVPEPSTWAMMILGFCCLGFMAYQRLGREEASSRAG
jgi:hypothetical protein